MDYDQYCSETTNIIKERFEFLNDNKHIIDEHGLHFGFETIDEFKNLCYLSLEQLKLNKNLDFFRKSEINMNLLKVFVETIKQFKDGVSEEESVHLKKILLTLNRLRLQTHLDGTAYIVFSYPTLDGSKIINTVREHNLIRHKCSHNNDTEAKLCHHKLVNLIKESDIIKCEN